MFSQKKQQKDDVLFKNIYKKGECGYKMLVQMEVM